MLIISCHLFPYPLHLPLLYHLLTTVKHLFYHLSRRGFDAQKCLHNDISVIKMDIIFDSYEEGNCDWFKVK
jgi:hypothetical protein